MPLASEHTVLYSCYLILQILILETLCNTFKPFLIPNPLVTCLFSTEGFVLRNYCLCDLRLSLKATVPHAYSALAIPVLPPRPPHRLSQGQLKFLLCPKLSWPQVTCPALTPATSIICTSEQHLLTGYPVLRSLVAHMSPSNQTKLLAKATTHSLCHLARGQARPGCQPLLFKSENKGCDFFKCPTSYPSLSNYQAS